MHYKTYIDESGNTGVNLLDANQQYFVLASVSIPIEKSEILKEYILNLFNRIKEKDEKEIKAIKWIKAKQRYKELIDILSRLREEGCIFSAVIIEKRYMASCLIVDTFLDGAYNDIEDYTWCNDNAEKKLAAQYFYDILNDDDLREVTDAFSNPTLDGFNNAYNTIFNKTKNLRYLLMLAGCHCDEIYQAEISSIEKVKKTPNYVAFPCLGGLLVKTFRNKNSHTDIIFDHCKMCNDVYNEVCELFKRIEYNFIMEKLAGIIPWCNIINTFDTANSKDDVFLQMSDVLATSIMKTLDTFFSGAKFTPYSNFIMEQVRCMLKENTFWYVLSDENFTKLASVFKDKQ